MVKRWGGRPGLPNVASQWIKRRSRRLARLDLLATGGRYAAMWRSFDTGDSRRCLVGDLREAGEATASA